jgi:phosphatidylserine/phosphatidylglycerophosphate/cardiolipin synthase-like enzyme
MEIGAPTPVKAHTTLGRLLTDASNLRNVQVRAILSGLSCNGPAFVFINSLLNGAAVGQHNHQKIFIVSNKERLVVFCGGVDIAGDRSNWHDVHCRIRGPAAQKLHDIFVQRWQSHPEVPKLDSAKQKLLPPPTSSAVGDKHVVVVRTFPKWLPPGGEHTIYDLIAKAIATSKRFIYMEDQYLVANTPMKSEESPSARFSLRN